MRRTERGFTLMELMVVIVIVAILAAVAVPLYINYVKDAKRTEAKGAIAAIISAEQVYYQNSLTYVNDATPVSTLKVDLNEPERNWTFTVSGASATGFTATAHGKADAAGLDVTCAYSRTTGATWTDAPPGP